MGRGSPARQRLKRCAAVTVVLIASPLDDELASRIAQVDERIELLYDPAVVPASRFMGDIAGDFAPDPARWAELLERAEVLYGIPGSSPQGLVDAVHGGPALRWVQARNAGAGQQVAQALELDRAAVERIAVTTASGVHAGPLAEFTLMGLLAFAKRLPRMQRDKARRYWPPQEQPSGELRGQTLLIVGAGAIGTEIARLAKAFGMTVLAVKRDVSEPVEHVDELHPIDRLHELAGRADALASVLPGTDATRGIIDAGVFAALKPEAVFVNVGRGTAVDEAALVAALRDGSLAGAALDVFEQEPLPPESPLWELENVLLSPHDTARVPAEEARQAELFCDNLRRDLAGEELRNRVDLELLY
jgi:phosphoglycerate dehydrogenase-like enzyme